MKAFMDEVRFEEGGVVVQIRKRAGHETAKDSQKNPPLKFFQTRSWMFSIGIPIESIARTDWPY